MGWKASTIIINKPIQVDHLQLLKDLGFDRLKKTEDERFQVAINPDDHKVYIGTHEDNLLICAPDIPMQFFEDNQTAIENTLTKYFPESEMCSIVLHSSVNLWGYAVIKGGKKIRARAGSADDGTFVESGEPLDEEKELLSHSTIDKHGQLTYLFEGDDEPMTEDQVGENFVFAVCKRYFGEELDRTDDALFETLLTGYSFETSDKTKPETMPSQIRNKEEYEHKPATKTHRWVIYTIIILTVLVWQILKRTVFNK